MTEFRILAEKISNNINDHWYCCTDLPEKEADLFRKWFKPTDQERYKYRHLYLAWMGKEGAKLSSDNNLRILALLFAEQLWLDMKEGER